MNYRAGFLKVVCVWMMILMQSSAKKQAAGASCNLKELTTLTKSLVEASQIRFDKANGKHIGTWSPGFPELQVHKNSSLNASEVQCSLLFMAAGLEKVLLDQKSNLNPVDISLHEKLNETISRVNMLAACVKGILGGECSPEPSPPTMPKYGFERKQWSHTLLVTAKHYLDWLELKTEVQTAAVKETNKIKRKVTRATIKRMNNMKRKNAEATRQNYLEGSGYLL
uniref:uncharacterized protein n=1 Tax=Semicossyphus pulcher TaxID=241346 RepID=UPI0037E6FB9F